MYICTDFYRMAFHNTGINNYKSTNVSYVILIFWKCYLWERQAKWKDYVSPDLSDYIYFGTFNVRKCGIFLLPKYYFVLGMTKFMESGGVDGAGAEESDDGDAGHDEL